MKETMTVHEALCELKTLRKRVEDGINESVAITYKEQGSSTLNGRPVKDVVDSIKSQHQSVTDLISRMIAIKAAVNQYNAEKKITVAGKEYSIAQAIYMKTYGIETKRELLTRYQSLLKHATVYVESQNGDKLNARAETAMTSIFGNKEKVDPEKYLEGLKNYKAEHMLILVDPLNLADVVKKMEEDIVAFESKVDSAIQIANATTQIDIEY